MGRFARLNAVSANILQSDEAIYLFMLKMKPHIN